MITSLVKKIVPSEFQPWLKSSRDCYISGEEFVIQPKMGHVSFVLKDIRVDTCVIRFKRESGNGIVTILSNATSKDYQINSITSQSISFKVGNDGIIQIDRDNRSRGDIIILDISLYAEAMGAPEWNQQISKSEKHHCLRLIGDDLHASEGGFIQGEILRIQTEPSNMFSRNENGVKFLGSCKIIDLSIGDGTQQKVKGETSELFDTNSSGFSPAYGSKNSIVNISGVVLDRHESYNIPLENISSGKKYKVDIEVSTIDGNGKFMFGILPCSIEATVKMSQNNPRMFSIETSPATSSNYSLSVWRHPSSKGRIRVSRIVISEKIDNTEIIKNREIRSIPDRDVEFTPPSPLSIISTGGDYVMLESKKFADFDLNTPAHTLSGMSWLVKVKTISNIKINASICSIDGVIDGKVVFLDSFSESQVTDEVIGKLKNSEVIYTPTEHGVKVLSTKLPGKSVKYGAKVWPYITPVLLPLLDGKDFIVITNRNDKVTRFIIESIPGINIVVLGARGNYPQNIIPINEYLEYNKLLWILKNAKVVIDFHQVQDHKSGLLDMTINLGTPIITSSLAYKEGFVEPNKEIDGFNIPSEINLSNISRKSENINTQREAFEQCIKEMNQ